jgi:hypothetical protein
MVFSKINDDPSERPRRCPLAAQVVIHLPMMRMGCLAVLRLPELEVLSAILVDLIAI